MDLTYVSTILSKLFSIQIPEGYLIAGGILFFVGSAFFATMFVEFAVMLVIRIFRLGGERGPVGKELAAQMLAAAGESGIALDEMPLDSSHRAQFGDMDYHPEDGRLELTEDKARGRSFASAGQIVMEVGRTLQYRAGFFPLQLRKFFTPVANVAGFCWAVPLLAATVLPLYVPEHFHPVLGYLSWALSALLFGFLGMFVLLKVPIDLDAVRRGASAMRKAGVFSPGETFVIYLFLAIVLSLLVFSALVIALNFFRLTARGK